MSHLTRGEQTGSPDRSASAPGPLADRRLLALSSCGRLMISATDELSLLRDICRVICEQAGYRLAWAGYLRDDPDRSIEPVAWSGRNSGYIERANISWSDRTERGRGPTGIAARSGESFFIQDFSTDERIAPWRQDALRRGYRSSIAVPLKDRAGAVFGVLSIYSSRAGGMTSAERWLLEQLSADLAFGITVLRDRVERRRAEEAVRELNRELERRVADRTSELEAANRELESFSYSVSHDLRSPLRAISGFSLILAEEYRDQLDERGRDYLDRIRHGAARMDQLISDILSFSRTGRSGLRPGTVDMTALARKVFAELRPAGRDIEFTAAALPAARGDSSLLEQVLANLIGNAIKFTATRSCPAIEVTGSRSDGQIEYRVRDNGAGFDPARAGQLFQPFSRLHSAAEFEGTGIGLAIVRRIVARHGGRVSATGAPDRGATFTFTLPAA